jgi:hypothetical protein
MFPSILHLLSPFCIGWIQVRHYLVAVCLQAAGVSIRQTASDSLRPGIPDGRDICALMSGIAGMQLKGFL